MRDRAGTEVLLVRHAAPLDPRDERSLLSAQGRAASERLAELLGAIEIAAIHASPAPRAVDTISTLAARLGCPTTLHDDLRERDLGPVRFADLDAAIRATWDDFAFAHPGGESNAAAQARIVSIVERLRVAHAGQRFVVATHGTVMALLLRQFDVRVDLAFWARISRPDLYRLTFSAPAGGSFARIWPG